LNFISKAGFVNGTALKEGQFREQYSKHGVIHVRLAREQCNFISVLLGDITFQNKRCLIIIQRKEWNMFVVAVVICLLMFVALASADVLISNINSDELSNMGVEKKS
jgi:hypothetical protein